MQGTDKPRSAATEEEGADQIGFETPRSGVATPHPDPSDKRLPGITSYFNQVRPDLAASQEDFSTISEPERGVSSGPRQVHKLLDCSSTQLESPEHAGSSQPCKQSLPTDSRFLAIRRRASQERLIGSTNSCLPPATSHSCSSSSSSSTTSSAPDGIFSDRGTSSASSSGASSRSEPESAKSLDLQGREAAARGHTLSSSDMTAAPISHPDSHAEAHMRSSQPSQSQQVAGLATAQTKWFSLQGLKQLTRILFKSGPPTPTRALSTNVPTSDGRETPNGSASTDAASSEGGETSSGTQTPKNSGSQASSAKGRLTIKIVEARGIRKSRDPYVVAVFQRSELISDGPHEIEEEEEQSSPSSLGAIPMKRQVSDSGRPMAIPMRSRQSSNTSIGDYNTFRNRNTKTLYSSPKWDAEAVL